MSDFNLISGYWIDDKSATFEGYITSAFHDGDLKITDLDDDSIFFYGIDRDSIDKAIKNKEVVNGEFVIETVESIEFI